MEPLDRNRLGKRPTVATSDHPADSLLTQPKARMRTPFSYRVCDGVSEGLIYFLVVFTPWAFGTTQPWSIWTLNIGCYLLGLLLIGKWVIRKVTGYHPSRWIDDPSLLEAGSVKRMRRIAQAMTGALAFLTVLILGYILTSAINARATFLPDRGRFAYHDALTWLPHSYDSTKTWFYFWSYLSLAFFFWSLRDWLLGKTAGERRQSHTSSERESSRRSATEPSRRSIARGFVIAEAAELSDGAPPSGPILPARLKRLLWVLCINGGVLALEGILQRLSGTGKLLWLVTPRFNKSAETQFGPWAYRANAATYFNLLWPLCLGFWIALRQEAMRFRRLGQRIGTGSHVVLLPFAVLMAACPIISTSRGGAIVSVIQLVTASALITWALRKESSRMRIGFLSVSLVILLFAGYLGWKQLAKRMETVFIDQMSRRTEIYENAAPIARDFPVFGTGVGTFGSVYFLYREAKQNWAAYVHDDYLEIRIAVGWIGFAIVMMMLALALGHWFARSGICVPWEFMTMLWIGMGGTLLHAKFDFPMQVHSLLFLFLTLSCISFCAARKHA